VERPLPVWLRTAQANKLETHPLKSKVQCVCLPVSQANSVSMAMSNFHHPSSEIHRHHKASVIFTTTGNIEALYKQISLRDVTILLYTYDLLLDEKWKFTKNFLLRAFNRLKSNLLLLYSTKQAAFMKTTCKFKQNFRMDFTDVRCSDMIYSEVI
jgi:hypothetical protein